MLPRDLASDAPNAVPSPKVRLTARKISSKPTDSPPRAKIRPITCVETLSLGILVLSRPRLLHSDSRLPEEHVALARDGVRGGRGVGGLRHLPLPPRRPDLDGCGLSLLLLLLLRRRIPHRPPTVVRPLVPPLLPVGPASARPARMRSPPPLRRLSLRAVRPVCRPPGPAASDQTSGCAAGPGR